MLVAVYFLNTQNKSPLSSKCISKFYYITAVEYSSPIKKRTTDTGKNVDESQKHYVQ